MEKMTVAEIAKAVGGKLLCGDGNTEVSYVCIDSRDAHEGALFVPIIGERVDRFLNRGQRQYLPPEVKSWITQSHTFLLSRQKKPLDNWQFITNPDSRFQWLVSQAAWVKLPQKK